MDDSQTERARSAANAADQFYSAFGHGGYAPHGVIDTGGGFIVYADTRIDADKFMQSLPASLCVGEVYKVAHAVSDSGRVWAMILVDNVHQWADNSAEWAAGTMSIFLDLHRAITETWHRSMTPLRDESTSHEKESALDEVKKCAGYRPERWRAFSQRDRREYEQVWEDGNRTLDYIREKLKDKNVQEQALAFLRENPCQFFLDKVGDLWSLTDRYPEGMGDVESQLRLKMTTPRGASTVIQDQSIERPAGWYASYGL